MARTAVIGAGISGLTAAHALGKQGHEVVVFEAGERPAGHTCTVAVGDLAIDMGFIVLNDRNYPGFTALLAELGVAVQPSEISFAVSSENGRFEYSSASLGGLFATLPRPAFARMLLDVRRFQREALALLHSDDDISLGHYLERGGYSRWFVDRLLVPQAAAVWSADPAQMWEFPARFLARFFHNHGILSLRDRPQWSTVTGGSQTYVRALSAGMDVRTGTPVETIRRLGSYVEL